MKRLLVLTLLLAACAKHTAIKPPTVQGTANDWAFFPAADKPGTFYILAKSDEALKNAMNKVGCGVCTSETVGEMYMVDVLKKAEQK